jgi:hypothetical protein
VRLFRIDFCPAVIILVNGYETPKGAAKDYAEDTHLRLLIATVIVGTFTQKQVAEKDAPSLDILDSLQHVDLLPRAQDIPLKGVKPAC